MLFPPASWLPSVQVWLALRQASTARGPEPGAGQAGIILSGRWALQFEEAEMERVGGESMGMPTSIRKVVLASFIGTTIEWYDYFIFATAAALFFPKVFFPGFGDTTGTILAYTTFAVGFGARPLGASSSAITGTGSGARPCSSPRCSSWVRPPSWSARSPATTR